MKAILYKLSLLFFILSSLSNSTLAQEKLSEELTFEVNRIYPYILVSKEDLKDAKTLKDLNKRYKADWVRKYLSVEIMTQHEGQIVTTSGKNEILTKEQKAQLNTADSGTNIAIKVHYIPENTLSHNDPKELEFTVAVDPENEATYMDGKQQLRNYLKEQVIDKIPSNTFQDYDLTAIKFAINEEGEIVDAHLFGAEYDKDRNQEIDNLLLETIRNMPCWNPAEYADGKKVKQEFVLTVGNMKNCVVNLLNIRRDGLPFNG